MRLKIPTPRSRSLAYIPIPRHGYQQPGARAGVSQSGGSQVECQSERGDIRANFLRGQGSHPEAVDTTAVDQPSSSSCKANRRNPDALVGLAVVEGATASSPAPS